MRTVRVGYKEGRSLADRRYEPGPWTENDVDVHRLVLLVPTSKVELLRMSFNYGFELPGASCPELPSDIAEQDDDAADVLPRRSPRLPETAMKVKDT